MIFIFKFLSFNISLAKEENTIVEKNGIIEFRNNKLFFVINRNSISEIKYVIKNKKNVTKLKNFVGLPVNLKFSLNKNRIIKVLGNPKILPLNPSIFSSP